MRDPNRIDALLRTVAFIWHRNPDLRLGQLLLNALSNPSGHNLYYLEDDQIHDLLIDAYGGD